MSKPFTIPSYAVHPTCARSASVMLCPAHFGMWKNVTLYRGQTTRPRRDAAACTNILNSSLENTRLNVAARAVYSARNLPVDVFVFSNYTSSGHDIWTVAASKTHTRAGHLASQQTMQSKGRPVRCRCSASHETSYGNRLITPACIRTVPTADRPCGWRLEGDLYHFTVRHSSLV